MGVVKKINFPYFLKSVSPEMSRNKRLVVFFGTDFYNLPLDSNREIYIERTNQILDYIRRHFKGYQLLYLPHPNEKDELTHLNLKDFELPKEHVIGELFLYENANSIEYVFSTCSWACGSAYAMGLNAAVFLETFRGAVSEETIIGYRSYFFGFPASFFINSFDQLPQKRPPLSREAELSGQRQITQAIGDSKKIWVLASDPALALRASIIIRLLRAGKPNLKASLLMINHRRWDLVSSQKNLLDVFDEMIPLPNKKVWYSARPGKVMLAIKVAHHMRNLSIAPGDVFISFSNLLFEENCILSYYPKVRKILFIESRWYNFIYEGGSAALPQSGFHGSLGTRFFNYILEPILGLHGTIFKEYKDGKVINIFRYQAPLSETYDQTFVLMP